MTGAGSADLFVDFTALGRMHDELKRLIGRLDGLDGCGGGADRAALGGDDAAEAVERFVGRWAAERRHLVEQLRDCAIYMEQSMREFSANEEFLKRVMPTSKALP